MAFEKVISTKNLYMAELQICLQTCISDVDNLFYTLDYVLIKPLNRNFHLDISINKEFVDILTNTKYISQEIGCLKGKVYIKSLVPFTNGRNYIMSKEVAKILQDQNPLFLDLASTMQKRKIKNF